MNHTFLTLFDRRALLLLFCPIFSLLVHPELLPPQDQLVTDQEAEDIEDSQHDQEPEEHLPGQGDESSDEEGSNGEAVNKEVEDWVGQMSGQLQSENPVIPDYATKKAAALGRKLSSSTRRKLLLGL